MNILHQTNKIKKERYLIRQDNTIYKFSIFKKNKFQVKDKINQNKQEGSLQWRTGSENIGCQETNGAHPHPQCYHLIFISNKYNLKTKYEWIPNFTNYSICVLYILLAVNRNTKCIVDV